MEIEKVSVEEFWKTRTNGGGGPNKSPWLQTCLAMEIGSAIRLPHTDHKCDGNYCSIVVRLSRAKKEGLGIWHLRHEAPHVALVYREA